MQEQLLLSLAVTCLIFNVILLVKIKFGDLIITNRTLKPYITSCVLLCVICAEFVWISYLRRIKYKDNDDLFKEEFFEPFGFRNKIESDIMQIKVDLMVLFVYFIAYELENLNVFICFQAKLRLQELHVERDTFLRLEKKVNNIFIIMITIFMAPNLFFCWGFLLYDTEKFTDDDTYSDEAEKSIWKFLCVRFWIGLLTLS